MTGAPLPIDTSLAALHRILKAIEDQVPGLALSGSIGPHRLAAELFPDEEGSPSVDPTMHVREIGVQITLHGEDWGYRGSTSSDPGIERCAQAAQSFLSEVQDAVALTTTNPWPEVVENGRRSFAPPGAIVRDGILRMWFGPEDDPVLEFALVVLEDC